MRDPDLVPIGTFAQAARLTVKALRHYHDVGILAPAWVDPATGYRSYRWEQLTDTLCIAALRDLDVPLERIARHVVGGVPLHEVLREERSDLERRALRVQRALAVVDALAGEEAFPAVTVDTTTWADRTVLALRASAHADRIGPAATEVIAALLGHAAGAGLDVDEPVTATYPLTLAGTITIAAHLPLAAGTDAVPALATEAATVEAFAGGPVVRAIHVGPHEALPVVYPGLLRELGRRGVPPRGPVYERYLDDPTTTDPARLRTEVVHRLA